LQPIAANNDGAIQMDAASVSRTGALVKLWLRQVFPNGLNKSYYPVPVGSIQTRWVVDCQRHAIAQGDLYVRDMQGATVYQNGGIPDKYEDIVPDSTGERIAKLVCKR
jgi:hypothetical protein